MSTPATPITFTLHNNSTSSIAIRSISYVDAAEIQHVSDYTGIGGTSGDTRGDTIVRHTKLYEYGDYLQKNFVRDTKPASARYTTMTGVTLTVESVLNIQPGWIASGNGLTGRSVVTVTPPTTLTLDGTYSSPPPPTIGGTVTFSTTTKAIIVNNSTNLGLGWKIIGNGYELADNAIITSINGSTLEVNVLSGTNSVVGSPFTFSSSTNYLTLNNNTSLETGFSAKNNGYNDTQNIISVLIDGKTVQMSAPPGSLPTVGNPITFTSNANLVVIPAYSEVTFSINYTSGGPVGTNYYSAITINATQLPSTPLVGHIDNYVNIATPAAPPPAPGSPTTTYTTTYTGGGQGGNRQTYVTTTYGYADGSTLSITTNENGTITSQSSTNADPGSEGDPGAGTVTTSVTSNPNASSPSGECFDPMALVTMHDGSKKHIKDIMVGDLLMNQQGTSNEVLGIVTPKLKSSLMYSFNKHWAFVSESHPILTTTGWAAFNPNSWAVEEEFVGKLSKIEIGTEIITQDGTELVTEIKGHVLPEYYTIYNLILGGDHTYIVEDCIVHNKKGIVCTAMNDHYGFGSFRNRVWLKYAEKNLTKAHEVGYHTIFLPLVNYGFKQGNGITNRIVRNILEHIARHRSTDIRAEMRGLKRDALGRAYRFILEPLCCLVGKLKGY